MSIIDIRTTKKSNLFQAKLKYLILWMIIFNTASIIKITTKTIFVNSIIYSYLGDIPSCIIEISIILITTLAIIIT